MQQFEQIIGHTYKNKELMEVALTHSSYANEANKHHVKNNERLEFLGDSVLGLTVAEYLFKLYPDEPEGELSKLRAALVCEKSLFQFAQKINLGDFIKISKGEEHTGGRERPSILSDAFEAVIASIYLDSGLDNAKKFILSFMPKQIDINKVNVTSDYKTALQEVVQKNREEKVEYVLVGESGPDHDKCFMVEIHLNSNVIGRGKGKSKKQAEQFAAKEALELMGYEA